MVEISLRHRHAVNKKEARHFSAQLNQAYGLELAFKPGEIELAQGPGWEALLQDHHILALIFSEKAKGARARQTSGIERLTKEGDKEVEEGPVVGRTGPCLTVRGVLTFRPTKNWVQVDMGAVPYLTNGAHVMAPGVVDAFRDIAVGDPVWVRDERNKQPLAVGWALHDGTNIAEGKAKGKVVWTLQFVGDEIWNYGEPEVSQA